MGEWGGMRGHGFEPCCRSCCMGSVRSRIDAPAACTVHVQSASRVARGPRGQQSMSRMYGTLVFYTLMQ